MAVPKKKVSPSRAGKRRTHKVLKRVNYNVCPDTGEIKLPHRIVSANGFYKGKQVVASANKE